MIIINNRIIPFGKRYLAINLLGIIFTKGHLSPAQRNHEQIHTRQQQELLYIIFYLFYVAEWLIRLLQYRNTFQAYRSISFEREAYNRMYDLHYLDKRKPYSWVKYFRLASRKLPQAER